MNNSNWVISEAIPAEFNKAGKILVKVYSQLDGFPKEYE